MRCWAPRGRTRPPAAPTPCKIQQTIFANPTLDAEFRAHKGLLTPAGGDSCVSVVVGASRGVGFATALELAKLGCQVYALRPHAVLLRQVHGLGAHAERSGVPGNAVRLVQRVPAPGELPTVHENTSSMIYPVVLGAVWRHAGGAGPHHVHPLRRPAWRPTCRLPSTKSRPTVTATSRTSST